MEEWRDHPTYRLQVSSEGNIRGPKGPRKFRLNRGGYYRLNCGHNGRAITVQVHQLVAETFLNKIDGYTVNHIDGNKKNNRRHNLEYISGEDNTTHAFRNGYVSTCTPVGGYYSKREFERQTGISRKLV